MIEKINVNHKHLISPQNEIEEKVIIPTIIEK